MNAKLEILQHKGVATYKELFEAKAIKTIHRCKKGGSWYVNTVLLDTNGNSWVLDPDNEVYRINQIPDTVITSPKK